jgi:hypothetical protein
MDRPLMQHGVGQLAELFAKSEADHKLLKQLEHELRYRQVPREGLHNCGSIVIAEA